EDRMTPSTFLVTSDADPAGSPVAGTLRFAIAQANLPGNDGSTVQITPSVTSAAINLGAGELAITSSLTIENRSGHALSIHQATAGSRVVSISGPQAINVTITGGSAASVLTLDGGSVSGRN